MFSVKGQTVDILGFVVHMVSVGTKLLNEAPVV